MKNLENEDFVCLNCRIEEIIDDILSMQDQLNDILNNDIVEYDQFSIIDNLEDSFTLVKRAKIKLLKERSYNVFRGPDGVKAVPPLETLDLDS